MTKKLKLLIGAGGLAIILGALYAGGFLDFLNPFSFRDYKSERFGYTLSYPRNWTLDDSRSKAPLDVLHDVNNRAVVLIQIFDNDDYATVAGQAKALAAIKKDFETRPEYHLNIFNTNIADSKTYFTADGLYRDSGGVWAFTQRGVFLGDKRAYNIVTRILTGHVDELGSTVERIVASFKL